MSFPKSILLSPLKARLLYTTLHYTTLNHSLTRLPIRPPQPECMPPLILSFLFPCPSFHHVDLSHLHSPKSIQSMQTITRGQYVHMTSATQSSPLHSTPHTHARVGVWVMQTYRCCRKRNVVHITHIRHMCGLVSHGMALRGVAWRVCVLDPRSAVCGVGGMSLSSQVGR